MPKAQTPRPDDASAFEEYVRDALDSLDEGFALFDSENRLVVCNQTYRDLSEPLTRDVDGKGSGGKNLISHLLDTAGNAKNQTRLEQLNDSSYLVSTHPTKLGGVVVTCRNVTETLRIEEEKKQSDDMVRMVLETSASSVMMTRLDDGEIIYRSPAAEEMYGIHKSAASHFADPKDREGYVDAILQTGKVDDYRARYKRADGETFIASNAGRLADYGGDKVIVSNVTDLTKHLEADSLMRTVLDASTAIISMVRVSDGGILYRTPAALRLFGDVGTAMESYPNPAERDVFLKQLRTKGKLDDYKLELLNGAGERFPASLSSRIIDYEGEQVIVTSLTDLTEQLKAEALIRKVLEACPVPVQMTRVETGELLFRSPETMELFGELASAVQYYEDPEDRKKYVKALRRKGWINDFRARFVGPDGLPFWGSVSARLIEFNGEEVIVSNTRDLTNDLALEKELSGQREMLFQNEKMSALGELLAGVAHELNNPLSIVVGHSLMLQEEEDDPESVRRISKISSAAERCAKIVKTFLAMARQQPSKMETTKLNAIVATAVDVAEYGKGNNLFVINQQLDDQLPDILADGDQITQVIINLLINAEQAIEKAGKGDVITVSTKFEKESGLVKLMVTDNGPGIPEDIRARIFEPYFTTKDVGEGTGIGLAFCHRIILSHQGQLSLDDGYHDGCRFVVTLPVNGEKPTPKPAINTQVNATAKHEILVVDDEVEVAELIAEILNKEGMEVTIVHTGEEAIKQLNKTVYDLILSDINMPNMSGRELYESVKQNFPAMLAAIAFISGDTMSPASHNFCQESGCPCLEKPVSPTELRQLVHGMLKNRRKEQG